MLLLEALQVAFIARFASDPKMENAFLQKLQTLAKLSPTDLELVSKVISDVRDYSAGEDIIREGDRPDYVRLMVTGWASRYQILENGRTRITAFLLPGDFCDTHITLLGRMDHSIAANMDSRVALVSKETMLALFDRPAIARALWWASLVDEGILRAWLVNVAGREGTARVAHLFCELHARLTAVGIASGVSFTLPLTQEQLGQALGLTPIHVNRMMRELKQMGLVIMHRKLATILDVSGLQRLCNFDPAYLHLDDKRYRTSVDDWLFNTETIAAL